MERNFSVVYLFKPEGTESGPSSEWIYYRETSSVDPYDLHLALSRVTFPGCVDIADNPGDLAAIIPGVIGFTSAEDQRRAYLQNRWGVDHSRSIMIGTVDIPAS
jgi:hypothetical protein